MASKAKQRLLNKARRESGSFLALPRVIVDSDEYAALSAHSVKLLIDLFAQFRGKNNGDLCAAFTVMKCRGWKSRGTLHRATRELVDSGWIILSRQGGRNKPSLFGLSFLAIDECKGKLDISETTAPPGTWRK